MFLLTIIIAVFLLIFEESESNILDENPGPIYSKDSSLIKYKQFAKTEPIIINNLSSVFDKIETIKWFMINKTDKKAAILVADTLCIQYTPPSDKLGIFQYYAQIFYKTCNACYSTTNFKTIEILDKIHLPFITKHPDTSSQAFYINNGKLSSNYFLNFKLENAENYTPNIQWFYNDKPTFENSIKINNNSLNQNILPIVGTHFYYSITFFKDLNISLTSHFSGSITIKEEPLIETQNIDEEQILNIYPNPTSNFLNIDFKENISDNNISVQLINQNGNIVLTQNFSLNNQNHIQLNLQSYSVGTYILKVNTNKKNYSANIIKL